MRLLHLALLISTPLPILAQAPPPPPPLHQDLEHTLLLPPDRAYRKFDTSDYDYSELSASAVSPFCKSFTFLCHLRCLQRDLSNPAVLPNTPGDPRAEISRCNGASSMSSSSSSSSASANGIKVLCLCSNGVDLTAEISYALEGVVDIQAAGGSRDGSGEGEAGQIRSVAYVTTTTTVTETMTRVVTATVTQVVNTCLPMPGAPGTGGTGRGGGDQGGGGVAPVVVLGVGGVVNRKVGGDPLAGITIPNSGVADMENDADMDDEDEHLYLEYDYNYQHDQDVDLDDAGSDQVDGVEYDLAGQDKDSKVREDL
ncbi:hypothetical protein BG005_006989 [Podila minutissima]|nr:hypothetical protein BG005_006989 [Podila minutissima]